MPRAGNESAIEVVTFILVLPDWQLVPFKLYGSARIRSLTKRALERGPNWSSEGTQPQSFKILFASSALSS
jgi:hypothetical protein